MSDGGRQSGTRSASRRLCTAVMADAGVYDCVVIGGNPFLLKEILGHSQISTPDRSIHSTIPSVVIDLSEIIRGGNLGWKNEKACDVKASQA